MKHSPVSRPDRPDGKGYVMSKRTKTKAAIPVAWPDGRFRTEIPKGKTFTAHAERPFDPVWGIERWGFEVHVKRGPQPFMRTDANGNPVTAKGPDGQKIVREVCCEGDKNYEHETDLHDVVVLTGTGPGRGTRHIEANSPDWRLPVGLTLRRPFSEAGEALLREMGLAKRHSDAFEPEPKLLRTALLTTCHVAPEILPTRTGAQIEAILRQHAPALGVVSETPADDRPALTELEQEILFVLDERETLTTIPQMCKVLKERRTGGVESTVKQAVRHLRELGLVERPQTSDGRPTRKGCRITARGKQYLTTS